MVAVRDISRMRPFGPNSLYVNAIIENRCRNVGRGVNRRPEWRNHWCGVRGFREMGQVVGRLVSVRVWLWPLR